MHSLDARGAPDDARNEAAEIAFCDMKKPENGEQEPLVDYVTLEPPQAPDEMLEVLCR
jgi:hypothetical protein